MIKLNNDQKRYLKKRVEDIQAKLRHKLQERRDAAVKELGMKFVNELTAKIAKYQFTEEELNNFREVMLKDRVRYNTSSCGHWEGNRYVYSGSISVSHDYRDFDCFTGIRALEKEASDAFEAANENLQKTFSELLVKLDCTATKIVDEAIFADDAEGILNMLEALEKDFTIDGDHAESDFEELHKFLEAIGIKPKPACDCKVPCDCKKSAKPAPKLRVARRK